jgi:hypothetical protein
LRYGGFTAKAAGPSTFPRGTVGPFTRIAVGGSGRIYPGFTAKGEAPPPPPTVQEQVGGGGGYTWEPERDRRERVRRERARREHEEAQARRADRAGRPLTPAEIDALARTPSREDERKVADELRARRTESDAAKRIQEARSRDEEIARLLRLKLQREEQEIVLVMALLAALDDD